MAKPNLKFANTRVVPDLEASAPVMPPAHRRNPSNAVSEPSVASTPTFAPTPPPSVGTSDFGDQGGGPEVVKKSDHRVRDNTSIDIEAQLGRRVRDAFEGSARNGKRGMTMVTLVLVAVRDQHDAIKDLWSSASEAAGDELFPGLTEKEDRAKAVAARPTVKINISGLTKQYTQALDSMVEEFGAPSRKALIEAALERQYPAKGRR